MGTKHYQAVVWFKNPRSFRGIKSLFPRAHIEICRDLKKSIAYCSKVETRSEGPWFKGWPQPKEKRAIELLKEDDFYDWQKDIWEELKVKADNRTVNWIYEVEGNAGKTVFCKKVVSTFNAIYVSGGKASDIKYQVASREDKDDLIVLFDFARVLEGKVSYTAIEEVKNGIFSSPKYESTDIVMNCPHVYVFANWLPDFENLSKDRWNVRKIGKKRNLIKHVM